MTELKNLDCSPFQGLLLLRSVWAENSWKINLVFVKDTWDGSLTPCGFRLGSYTSHKKCFMTTVSWKTVESSPGNEKLLSQTTIKIISATHVCRENDILSVWSRTEPKTTCNRISSVSNSFFSIQLVQSLHLCLS